MTSLPPTHILVVNHAAEILDLMRELLEEAGYQVTTLLRDGQSLDTVVTIAPDLIVIDYMWPSSDNEWTLLNLLTIDPRTRDIPVIICTAAVRHVQDMQDHLARIGVQVIHKPFNIDDLLGMITTTLDARQLAARTPPDGMEGDGYRG